MRSPLPILPCFLAALAFLSPATGQETEIPPPIQDPIPSVQDIEEGINGIQANEDLTEDQKTEALAALNQALPLIPEGDRSKAAAEQFAAETEARPAVLDRVQSALAEPPAETEPDADPSVSLQETEQAAAAARATATATAEALVTLSQEVRDRPARRVALPQLISEAEAELTALPEALTPDPDEPPQLSVASRTLLVAQRYELTQRIASLQNELARNDGGGELLTAQRDLAARHAAESETLAAAWEQIVQERRAAEAAEAELRAAQAVEEARGTHRFLERLARENQTLAEQRSERTSQLEAVEGEKTEAQTILTELLDDRSYIESQIAEQNKFGRGLSPAIGALLRERLEDLPRTFGRSGSALQDEIGEVLLTLNTREEQRQELVDNPDHVDQLLIDLDPPVDDPQELAEIRAQAVELLRDRLESLTATRDVLERLRDGLWDVNRLETTTLDETNQFANFITAKVLWIRSASPVWDLDFRELDQAVAWFLSPAHWASAGRAMVAEFGDLDPVLVLTTAILILLVFLRRRMKQAIDSLGVEARGFSSVSFSPTRKTMLLVFLVAAPLPLFVWMCGTRLVATVQDDFITAVGQGLLTSMWTVFMYCILREMLRPGSLADAHLQWQTRTTRLFMNNVHWLFPIGVVCNFVSGMIDAHGDADWTASLGRMVLNVQLLANTVFFWRVLHVRKGIVPLNASKNDSGYFPRFRRFWFFLGIGIPGCLLVLSLFGFEFTSRELHVRMRDTMTLVIFAVFTSGLILRHLALSRRKLALKQAAERAAAEGEVSGDAPSVSEALNLSTIDQQSRKFLRSCLTLFVLVGSWGIWADVTPALGILETYQLWVLEEGPPVVAVTLANVLLSLVWIVMTVLATRNIPGALEMLVLQRLKIRPGERNAITTITRYAILLIGIIGAFSAIGIGWDKVQWLAAAVSVGLGFGMQEIFANFVSGLIILFERPVRVGDLVTVGTTTVGTTDGFVTRIQMRATTVTDFDRRELVIPNKQFITGSIINWSLSDPMLRVVVKVGVAFGSDIDKGKEILHRLAVDNPLILEKPEPRAVFKRFGDHTLDLELWAYLPSRDERVQVSDELHTKIDKEFRAAGIEIALPKQDINVHTEPAKDWVTKRGVETAPRASLES